MPKYLVETYLARSHSGHLTALERRARLAAEAVSRQRTAVRFYESIHVPEDEICFYVFDAANAHDVADVAKRAGLGPIRVVEAIASRNSMTAQLVVRRRGRT
ncbi:MAG TPA: hypothetical protein VFL67_00355 [Mycobacterium sp.]|nr:hypothetical protein [Mycobacterium sp.]